MCREMLFDCGLNVVHPLYSHVAERSVCKGPAGNIRAKRDKGQVHAPSLAGADQKIARWRRRKIPLRWSRHRRLKKISCLFRYYALDADTPANIFEPTRDIHSGHARVGSRRQPRRACPACAQIRDK